MREKKILLGFAVTLIVSAVFVFNADFSTAKDMTAQDLVAEAKKTISSISVEDAKAMHGQSGVIFLDVREPKEYKAGHIPGAINIPRGLVEFKITNKIKNKDTKIVVYCKKGGRACLSGCNLIKMGYKNVKNMGGGWKAWTKKGYPVE
jgi:rhodanese-related sulfurtransferase